MDITTTTTGASLLDGLRARNAKVRGATTTRVVLAGYKKPYLFGVYRLIGPDESKEIGDRLMADFESDIERLQNGSLDLLVRALERFDASASIEGPYEPLTVDGEPLTRWDQLAAALGHDNETARADVVSVFMDNPHAAYAHARQLQEWMGDTSIGVDREFLGEA